MKKLKLMTASFILIAVSLIIFYGCKKTGVGEPDKPNTGKQEDLAAIYTAKLKGQPTSATMVVNLPGKGYYADLNGNKVTINRTAVPNANRTEAFTCIDPADSEFDQEIVSITREYTCNTGYRFVVQYRLETEIEPLITNSSGQVSRGRIQLRNAANGVIYTTPTTTINPVISIVNNGILRQNSNGDDVYEVVVTYRSEIISETIYNQSASVRANLIAYTDCSLYPQLVCPFSAQQQVAGSQHDALPCTRIDKVYWNPSSGLGASTAGCNALPSSCFPWGYVFPNRQEIEIYANGQWQQIRLWRWASGGGTENNNTGLISPVDIWYISMTGYAGSPSTIPVGTYNVRYRNNHNVSSNGGPCVTQPSGTWITESWYISI